MGRRRIKFCGRWSPCPGVPRARAGGCRQVV